MGVYPLLEDETCWFLALQHEPRQQGNSVFVDERFEQFADQWAFLTSVQRIEPTAAEALARDATRTGQIVGVRFAEVIAYEEAMAPRNRLPSGLTQTKRIIGPMLMRMFEKRLTTYRAIGYARGEAPLGFAEPVEEQTLEYDQEALRHFETDL